MQCSPKPLDSQWLRSHPKLYPVISVNLASDGTISPAAHPRLGLHHEAWLGIGSLLHDLKIPYAGKCLYPLPVGHTDNEVILTRIN